MTTDSFVNWGSFKLHVCWVGMVLSDGRRLRRNRIMCVLSMLFEVFLRVRRIMGGRVVGICLMTSVNTVGFCYKLRSICHLMLCNVVVWLSQNSHDFFNGIRGVVPNRPLGSYEATCMELSEVPGNLDN